MKQGTGKTRVALELAGNIDTTLVVFIVPNSLKKNMESEIEKWSFDKKYLIETYEGISMSDRRYLELREKLQKEPGGIMMICDESIFIKNDKTKRFQRLKDLSQFTEYRLLLNGTPLTRDEWDLYNQMDWLSPKIINMDRQEFLNKFFTRHEYKKKGEKARTWYEFSQINADYLTALISPYTFYVDLEFNKKEIEHEINAYASQQTSDEYYELKGNLIEALENFQEIAIYEFLGKMEKLVFTDTERLRQIADSLQKEGQIIIFGRYVDEASYIASKTKGYLITGATPTEERTKILEAFKNDSKPLAMTYGVGSFGLNLQFCHKMAFSGLTFDYGKVDQAKYRIKRLGQEKDIQYYFFPSDLGIYNMIKSNLHRKESLDKIVKREMKEGGRFEEL